MTNYLVGEEFQWTDEVNEITGKGRHSTTARELIVLPGGGMLIDNPGIREVHMCTDETTLRFTNIAELAARCKFHDCKHASDAGCAIRAPLAAGKLERARSEGFQKLEAAIEKLRASRKKRQMTGDHHLRRIQQSKSRKHAERHDPDREDERFVR